MRDGWKIKTLGEVCEIYNGGTPSTNIPEYWDGGIQWITPKDMGRSKDMYVSHCERTISQEGVEHSSTKVLPERSVIVSSRAPIGYVAINEVPMATNQGCKGFVLGKEIYPEFLYYFLLSSTDLLNKLGTGATFKEVSGKKLAGIELPFPSISEQQRIVDILDREFAKIDALKANAEKSLQAAKDLFQATLKKELEPKEGWVIKPFGEICDIFDKRRKPISKRDREPGPYPYYGASCIQDYVKDYLFDGRYLLIGEDGAKWGPGDDTAYIVEGKFWVNNHAHIVKARDGFLDDYLRYYIKQLDLNPLVAGAIIPKLTQEKLVELEIPVPSFELQQEIVSKLDNLNDRCNALQKNYQKTLTLCDDLKLSLLRKAFNGEL